MKLVFLACLVVLLVGCGQMATPAPIPTAGEVVAKLKEAGLPVGQVVNFTAETDVNKLLGRPHQYVGKSAWVDTTLDAASDPTSVGAGGGVETFGNPADTQTRALYVGTITKQPLFAEYGYVSAASYVFLRLSGRLTPDRAEAYFVAAKKSIPDLVALP